MAHCVNRSHPDFLKLADITNINPIILAAKISLWQEKNGLDKFPTVQELAIIKPGVEELFNSNPELANQVYEALGFNETIPTGWEKGKTTYSKSKPVQIEFKSGITELPNGNYLVKAYRTDDTGSGSKGFGQRGEGLYLSLTNPYPGKDVNIVEFEITPSEIVTYKEEFKNTIFYGNLKKRTLDFQFHDAIKEAGGKAFIGGINSSEDSNLEIVLYDKDLIEKVNKSKKKISNFTTNYKFYNLPTEAEKQQALQLYSQYIDTGKQDIERFKDFVSDKQQKNIKSIGENDNLQYQFKLVDKIYNNLEKVNKLWKQIGNNNTFWNKVQQDLQIPKEQIELLKESEGDTIEEKLTSFAANYSYTVKINIAKEKEGLVKDGSEFKVGEDYYYSDSSRNVYEILYSQENGGGSKKISKQEFENARQNSKPTSYYSNLTVPGGTNYTENEIATPEVIPSIKGHAQFATDKGIGWFRSDEQAINQDYSTDLDNIEYDNMGRPSNAIFREITTGGQATKTRRILEVQSDYFQKLRNNFKFNGVPHNIIIPADNDGKKVYLINEEEVSANTYNKAFEDFISAGENNKFLALLQKDDNWVTFFVKSIVQDSAKKGYEKVLFPSGNTASKVEGHTTLEEFKKEKEDRIKKLEIADNRYEKWLQEIDENGNLTGRKAANKEIALKRNFKNTTDLLIDRNEKEINQLKEELKRVDEEGFAALKPIYNFYENTVKNVLNKQYGKENVKEVTDEYGNTWNEVTLTEKNKEEIYLQKEAKSKEKADKELNNLILNFLEKLGISVNSVNDIKDANGNVIDAVAKADMLNKIIDIVEGKADITTLPEEAAHFFVEMLGENNELLKQMMSKITSYKIYQETVEQYRNNSQYRNKDGSLNINKLKKEAIGKLISQHIVKHSSNETNANLKTFDSWWSKLWNLIKNIFNKSQTDPFKTAAEKILKADVSELSETNVTETGEYYQLSGVDKLKQHQKDINLDNSIDPKTGQKRHVYTFNGKDIKSSVTSKYVDAWLKRKYPNDNRNETQKKLDLLKADYGDIIHEMMEDIIDSYVDPETNLVRTTPVNSVNKNSNTTPYKLLEKYVIDLLDNFNEPGTKFMREVKIYDPIKDVAGSIDLLIITPEGEANIYDWKSQEIGKGQTELKPYKETMYRIQLQEYKKILQTHYDIKDFGLVRAIPIKAVFDYKGSGVNRTIDGLNKLEIGNFEPSEIPDEKNYLLPITLRDEKTNDKELSSYIRKLNSVMDILENKKYKTQDERNRKKIELTKYKNAVRDLQLKGDVRKFIELGNYEINKYKKMLSSNTLLPKDAIESLEILEVFTNTTRVFDMYMNELKKIKKESKDKTVIEFIDEIINDYNEMNSNADVVLGQMQEAIKNLASKFAQEKTGITDLLNPETNIDQLSGWFNSLSSIKQKSFRVLSRMLGDAQNKRDNLFNDDFEELIKLKKEYTEWAKSKGLSDKDLFKPLLNYNDKNEWTGTFLKKYQSEFYDKMKEAIQSDNVKWLIDNTEFDQEKFDKSKKNQKEFYDSIVYDSKDKENNKKLQKQAYETWLLNHDVNIGGLNKNKQAYLNMDNYNGKKTLNSYLKPKEKWHTKQWKELSSTPIALKTYEYFQKLLKRSAKAGVIDEYSPAFIPNIFRNKIEQFVFGGDTFSRKGFLESFEVESGESPFAPQINPITGEIEHSIPTHYIRDIGVQKEDGSMDYSQKSMDLFRIFGIWSAQLANYEAMSEIEDNAKILLFAEKTKQHIETDKFDNPVFEGGVLKEIPGNEINSKLLETFINFYFYNKKSGNMSDAKIPLAGKEYSGGKALSWLVRFFSLKTLALNPLSGTANFVGGTGNAFFQASKGIVFNTSDWTSSIYDLTRRDEIAWGLLGVSDVLLDDSKDSKLNKLSVSKIINANTIDKAFVLMRTSDKAVQSPVAIALMKNHMVDEKGNIVDIQTYVKAKYNYNEEYYKIEDTALRNSIRKKIEDEVTQLKESKSIYKTAKIVNDKIEIPGIDFKSEAWGRFRLKIKKVNKSILGNSTRDDINQIKTNTLGSMAMQFRSWMPQMIQDRFGELKYDQDLEVHTLGRFNLWITELFSKRTVSLLSGIISASGTNMINAARERYLIEKAKALEKGQEFTISEGEFVDLYIGNIRAMYREFLTILGIGALMFTALSGDDDDEEEDNGWRSYAGRAMRKYFDEFAFFFIPTSWSNLVNKPLPVVGLSEDFFKFVGATFEQSYGFVLNDEDILEDAKPAKYLSKMLPIFKEGVQMRAIFDDDFRKDWDIRFNASNR